MNVLRRYIVIGVLCICFSVNLCGQSAQRDKLWQEVVNAAEQGDEALTISNCRKLILKTELFDSLAVMAREMLAELSLAKENMNDIYENLVFFRHFNEMHPSNYDSHLMTTRLDSAYWHLVAEDMKKSISDGLYFSDYYDLYDRPLMVLNISIDDNDVTIDASDCGLVVEKGLINKYRSKSTVMQQENDSNVYVAYWGLTPRMRNPDTEMANSVTSSARKFQAEMKAEMVKKNYSAGDHLAETAVTTAVVGAIGLLANSLAIGKKTTCSSELFWKPIGNGVFDAKYVFNKIIERTDRAEPKVKTEERKFKLYKIYPHYNMIFYSPKLKRIESCMGPINLKSTNADDLEYFRKFNPIMYDKWLREKLGVDRFKSLQQLKKVGTMSNAIYKNFAYNNIFASLKHDSLAVYAPSLDEMTIKYFSDGSLAIGKWSMWRNEFNSFVAFRNRNNVITYRQLPKDLQNSYLKESIYFPNGDHILGEFWGTSSTGTAVISYKNGYVYKGHVKKGLEDGVGIGTWPDGTVFKGTFAEGKRIDGVMKYECADFNFIRVWKDGVADSGNISYSNGNNYVGEVDNDFIPNGEGTMTYANGKIQTGKWNKGHYVQEKPVVEPKKIKTKSKLNLKGRRRK